MNFRILGLDPSPFTHLYEASNDELARQGVMRVVVSEPNSAPDRIELRDALPGETVLLLNHAYLDTNSPYKGRHAIFVREGAIQAFNSVGEVPECMRRRLLSLRAFDDMGMMIDADVCEGSEIEVVIERLFSLPNLAFIHAHHARRGCYAARIERA